MKSFRPLGNQVLVKRAPDKERSDGGLILPERAQERSLEAIVVAVGTGSVEKTGVLIPCTVKPGDRVLITKWAGTIIELDGEPHCVLREYADVYGLFEDDGAPAMLHQGEAVVAA